MITDVGKSIASTKLLDGCIVNFFNKTLDLSSTISFKDQFGNVKYEMTINSADLANKYRCCYFSRSFPQSSIYSQPRIVLNLSGVNVSSTSRITAQPLFETMFPSISKFHIDQYQLSWWSNIKSVANLQTQEVNGSKFYVYDSENILKFSYNTLGDIEESSSSAKILCTANIRWEKLAMTANGVTDIAYFDTPIIDNPTILLVIQGQGYVTDFSGGGDGGGGGLSLHNHTSNEDGGFAASVFMPSANLRMLNWK